MVSDPSVRPGRCYKSTKEEEVFPPPTDLTAHSVPCPSKNISARPTRKQVRWRGRQTTYADGERGGHRQRRSLNEITSRFWHRPRPPPRPRRRQARPRVWPPMPPPAKVKQSRKLVAVGRRTDGVHDDDGDVVLAEAGGRGRALGSVVGRTADGRTEERAWQLFRNATLLTTSRGGEAFLHPRTLPQPRRVSRCSGEEMDEK